jgi:hypothetical protein
MTCRRVPAQLTRALTAANRRRVDGEKATLRLCRRWFEPHPRAGGDAATWARGAAGRSRTR